MHYVTSASSERANGLPSTRGESYGNHWCVVKQNLLLDGKRTKMRIAFFLLTCL